LTFSNTNRIIYVMDKGTGLQGTPFERKQTDAYAMNLIQNSPNFGRSLTSGDMGVALGEAVTDILGQRRKDLADRLLGAQRIKDDQDRSDAISDLRAEGRDDLGIPTGVFDRVSAEQQRDIQRQEAKSWLDSKIDSRPLSQRRRKAYAPNKGLKDAIRLRKKGFSAAANKLAYDWASSRQADAPSIQTPAMREEEERQSFRSAKMRDTNRNLQLLLMRRLEDKLMRDPNFLPSQDIKFA